MCMQKELVFKEKAKVDEALEVLKPGWAVAFDRGCYQHFAIYIGKGYLSKLEAGEISIPGASSPVRHIICQLSNSKKDGKGVISVEDFHTVAKDSKIIVFECSCSDLQCEAVIETSLGCLGETHYSLQKNNCEHFVRRILENESVSYQVKRLGESIRDLSGFWRKASTSSKASRLNPDMYVFLLREPDNHVAAETRSRVRIGPKFAYARLSPLSDQKVRSLERWPTKSRQTGGRSIEGLKGIEYKETVPLAADRTNEQEELLSAWELQQHEDQSLMVPGNLSPTVQTQLDVTRIKEVFGRLDFELRVAEDLPAYDIDKLLHEVAIEEEIMHHGCFVCFLMAHGNEKSIFGSNGNALELNRILETFQSDICPGLLGKPKIFFVQACRGQTIEVCEESTDSAPMERRFSPKGSDFLVCRSSTKDSPAYRNSTTGSFFVQTVCNEIEKHHSDEDIKEIMTRVNAQMERARFPIHSTIACTISEFTCTLTKKCLLKPLYQ
uniref:Caspase-8-like n=1 Tax=Macrostomum lignano TaxID=282301 RepID=A0A1I8GH60_9PLAT